MNRHVRVCDVNVSRRRRRRGFTLIEMAVALVVLGLIAIAIMKIFPRLTDRMRLDSETVGLGDASEAIDGFALKEHRLPCPDVNGDGEEGTGGVCDPADQVGTIPYRSLGLPGPVVDAARLPLRYGVYRNSAANADFTTLTNLYEPTLPGRLDITPGTVTACGEVLDNAIQIIYSNQSEDVLTVSSSSGSFNVDDYVSGSTLDYNNVTPNANPTPTNSTCPCGGAILSCNQCTNFVPGEKIFLQGNSSAAPSAAIDSIVNSGSRLLLPFPTGTFNVGDTIEGEDSGVTATVTSFYFPGTATIDSITTAGQVFDVTLTPVDQVWFDSTKNFGFVPGQTLFSSSGGRATYVNLQGNQQGLFQLGETVTGQSSGASGTVEADNGTVMTVSNVSGTFIGPPTNPTVDTANPSNTSGTGERIVGSSSGADANIVSISDNVFADPVVTAGSITIPDPNVTPSNQLNELDMCKNLRNGILAAGSADQVYTVHDPAGPAVNINPAYLVVSGGVEDAIPGDVAFDGLNEGAGTLDFNSPALGRSARYDDVVRTTPMQWLDNRLSCPRNLAAVNAMAVNAMAAQNIAISTFNNHENALSAISAAWTGLKLADASVGIEAFLVAIAATECGKATAEALLTDGGSAAAAAAACASAVLETVNFAFAIDAQVKATAAYNFFCADELEAATQMFQATDAATTALDRALEADRKEGVR